MSPQDQLKWQRQWEEAGLLLWLDFPKHVLGFLLELGNLWKGSLCFPSQLIPSPLSSDLIIFFRGTVELLPEVSSGEIEGILSQPNYAICPPNNPAVVTFPAYRVDGCKASFWMCLEVLQMSSL